MQTVSTQSAKGAYARANDNSVLAETPARQADPASRGRLQSALARGKAGPSRASCLTAGICLLLACGCGGSDKHATSSSTGGAGALGSGGSSGTGDSGASGAGTGDSGVPTVEKEAIGNQVFDESQVQSYYLTFTDAEYGKLMDFSTLLLNPYTVNEDRYVQAALKVGDTELPTIGVRFKGNYSIWGCIDYATKERVSRLAPQFGNIDVCQRFSLKLDFNRFDDTARLDGLKKLNLHAMAADPSKLRERLGYSLFRDMDVLAPRAVHARLYINGQYQGLVAAVEEVDGRFTANRFPESGDGNLYRDLWPTSVITTADAANALRTNDAPGETDVADFMAFRDAIAASTDANFAGNLAPYLDLDYLARYIVVDRAISNFDGIMSFYFGSGWGPNNQNYFWYDVGNGRFALIPWDFDKILWYPEPNLWSNNAPDGNNLVPNWNVITNTGCQGYQSDFDAAMVYNGVESRGTYWVREIDCDPFLKLLRGAIYARQKAVTDAFIAGPFSAQSVAQKLDTWRAQITTAIADDPLMDPNQWQTAVDYLHTNLPNFQGNVSLMMSGLINE